MSRARYERPGSGQTLWRCLTMTKPNRRGTLAERLARRLQTQPSGCIVFTGFVAPTGYGQIWSSTRMMPTHRVAYELAHGPIPDGLLVCHRCDNPPCCNVDHLFLGTQKDNMADMSAKGRAHHARACSRGHEYTESNTAYDALGKRLCRACMHIRAVRDWQRVKEARLTNNREH